jgi:hypothetical protein
VRWTGGVVALLVGSLALAAAGGALVFVPATGAAEVTITVAGTSDGTGSCSGSGTTRTCPTLRAAVVLANSLNDPVTIQLQDGRYELSIPPATADTAESGDLDVTKRGGALRIVGRNATTIAGAWPDANQADRLFDVGAGATLILEKLTLSGGRAVHDDARDHKGARSGWVARSSWLTSRFRKTWLPATAELCTSRRPEPFPCCSTGGSRSRAIAPVIR